MPQYEEDSDGELWLSNFLSNLNSSTPDTKLKECESKKPDTEIMRVGEASTAEEIVKIGCAAKPKNIECSGVTKPTKMKLKKIKSPEISNSLNHDNWLGYIIAVFINETITQSIACCLDVKTRRTHHSSTHTTILDFWKNCICLHLQ